MSKARFNAGTSAGEDHAHVGETLEHLDPRCARIKGDRVPRGAGLGEGSRLIYLPVGKGEHKLGFYPLLPDFTCAVHRFREEEGLRYHLVHSHYWLSGWVGSWLARWWHVPHLVSLHTSALVPPTSSVRKFG